MIFSPPTTRHNIAIFLLNGAFIASTILTTGASGADSVDSSWDGLLSSLSHEDSFVTPNVDDWYDQCVKPFGDLDLSPTFSSVFGDVCSADGVDCPVSNYQLLLQPSGLCMGALVCGYKKCTGGPDAEFWTLLRAGSFNSSIYPAEQWKYDERLDLPKGVVHPIHVGDVSAAIKYAAEHKIEISVKNAGHSYTGSSMKKNSLLLKLSKLKKYSPYGSIVNCQVDPNIKEGAYQDACDYAIARNKPAVIRVGGGELWDEVLRALYLDFNDGGPDQPKFHIVSGASGTISAAGGWLASGGLGATAGMRLYGLGIDQVLHVEMVLPNGIHVRFGPTEWEKEVGKICPATTHVKGYCNIGDLSNEDLWDWQDCSEDIDFNGLWFAVRGGGGGTYGVVTSIYYQLHDYSPIDFVTVANPFSVPKEEGREEIARKWIEFVLRFLYLPESVGVTEFASNSCSSPSGGGLNGGFITCFNGAGSIMRGAWERFYPSDAVAMNVFTLPSWAHFLMSRGTPINNNVPEGRAADIPIPKIYPSFHTGLNPSTQEIFTYDYVVFPIEVIVHKVDIMVEMFFECMKAGACTGAGYFLGGKIPSADDGMTSLPTHRRHGAFNTVVTTPEWRTKFKQVFYGVEDGKAFVGDSFPGELCHNHASANYPTALKDDWTQGCDPSWNDEMRKEKCLSFQEASWGTDVLMKLQDIHAALDPDNLFNCWDCVGNAPDIKKEKKNKKKKKVS